MNKGFQHMARKYEDGGEAESRKQQIINKAMELFGDASETSIMKVLQMLSGPMPMSFAAGVASRAHPQAAENLRNSGSELMGKVGQAAQTVGGYTLAPYIAKGMGFDRAANALGLPYDDEGNMIPGRMPKYPPENKADGGAVMQRPLFRNMGGPAAPMPQDMAMQAPPPMAPPPMQAPPMPAGPEQELMAVEQSMEGVGRNYVESMVGGIDAAEDVTSMINALRGNEAPLEARYAELAGYVGEADASQTPESVLAMVQPTILMTEEGAVDSGIGQLMQGIAGSDMETPTGDPTAMGQGVGELMAMGAGSTPPVNFRHGGEVQHFFEGGSPVISNAQKMAPEYQKYFESAMNSDARAADLEEQKRLSQAQIFFDIAQTALAAGAPTDTPMSAAERIAGAVGQTQLFDKMGQRSSDFMAAKQAQRAEDRQMRMAGLQGALGQSQADEAARQDLELAKAKLPASKPISLSPGDELYDSTGKKIATNSTLVKKNITLSPGEIAFDADGTQIASSPAKPVTYTLTAGSAAYDSDGEIIAERANKPQALTLGVGEIAFDAEGTEIARGNEKPAIRHLLGLNQILTDDDGTVIAKGKEVKEVITLGPGQKVINVEDGEVIAEGTPLYESVDFFKVTTTKAGVKTLDVKSVNITTEAGQTEAAKLRTDGYASNDLEAVSFLEEQRQESDSNRRKEEIELRAELDLNNRLEEMGTAFTFDMAKLDVTAENAQELAQFNFNLSEIAREDTQGFTAAQNALNRMVTRGEGAKNRTSAELRSELDRELRESINDSNLTDAEKSRALQNAQFQINAAFKTHEALQGDEKLTLDKLTLDLKEKYQLGMLAVSEKEAEARAKLNDIFGAGKDGKVASIVSSQALLDKYATGTLDKAVDGYSDSEVNAAFLMYTAPQQSSYDPNTGVRTAQPGNRLNSEQIAAIRARRSNNLTAPAGLALTSADLRSKNPTLEALLKSPYQLKLGLVGFGSAAFLGQLTNIGVEALSLGLFNAPFTNITSATTAVDNLNQEFETVFLAAQDIRDSVFQGKKLENLTPDPAKFWTPSANKAKSMAATLVDRLDQEIALMEWAVDNPEIALTETGTGSLSLKQQQLPRLYQIRDGYALLAGIVDASGVMGGPETALEKEQRILANDLDKKRGVTNNGK